MRFITWTVFALLLVSQTAAVGAERVAPKQYIVSPSLHEMPCRGSKRQEKILADPNVAVLANEEADFSVGGEKTVGANKVPYGTTFKVKVEPVDGKTVRVTGVLDVSEIVAVSEVSSAAKSLDDEVVPRESFSIHFAKPVTLGKTLRVCVSKTRDTERWFELLVDELDGSRVGREIFTPTVVGKTAAEKPASKDGGEAK